MIYVLIPIAIGYVAHYYLKKHEYNDLVIRYEYLSAKYEEIMSEKAGAGKAIVEIRDTTNTNTIEG